MEEISKEQEVFWRNQLKNLRGPLPEVGLEPPKDETIKEPQKELIGGIDSESIGTLSKISMDIYFFLDNETNKYYMMQGQSMVDFGERTLKQAIEIAKRKQRRNKG